VIARPVPTSSRPGPVDFTKATIVFAVAPFLSPGILQK
jgi:hypothetical protein